MIIGWLKGRVLSTGEDSVLIDVGGVGYVALAGSGLLARLSPGEETELHVETRVSESSIQLFAFESDEARAWFVRLNNVQGVGGKVALAVLDAVGANGLMDAVALGDAAALTRAKGVGKKVAERIVTELSGKAPPIGRFGQAIPTAQTSNASPEARVTGARAEAISALVNLGYPQTEAGRAIASAAAEVDANDVSALIKAGLKSLSA